MLDGYGPQGWWPILGYKGINPTKTGSLTGYHPDDYDFPRNDAERFEICIGAVLTQNTAWLNVEKALLNLKEEGYLCPRKLLEADDETIAEAIKPSGYFNVKTRKIKEFSRFYLTLEGRVPARDELLSVWGIGPETADCMRLYAYNQPEMVVDAYTRRILEHLGMIEQGLKYEALKAYCVNYIEKSVQDYQEFHALMVDHAKRHYSKKPYQDPFSKSVN